MDITNILKEFNLIQPNNDDPLKDIFVTTDSASANIKAVRELNVNAHIPCFNHMLNNSIKATFEKDTESNKLFIRVKSIANYIRNSEKAPKLLKS